MFKKEELDKLIEDGYLIKQVHPELPLTIYNYSDKCQYDGYWNEITLNCRGLILDENMNIVARPLKKFFNHEQQNPERIPFEEDITVYTKMDGSYGQLYFIGEDPFISTRGSFQSEQAIWANDFAKKNGLIEKWKNLDKDYTYVFEIIYKTNKIVVDYKDFEGLVLLAVINKETGKDSDKPLESFDVGTPIVERHDGLKEISYLISLEEKNKEGFVVKFSSGFRLKVKFKDYIRLHRLMTMTSTITIWEELKNGKDIYSVLENVPDEFYNWVKQIDKQLKEDYDLIESQCKEDFYPLSSRKETAELFRTKKYPGILFSILDGKPYDKAIWKMIRPKFSKPFASEDEKAL